MTMLTNDELQAIRKRCNAATPGPWEHQNDNHFHVVKDSLLFATMRVPYAPEVNCDNASFIAHARADIPALLAHIEAQQDALPRALTWTMEPPKVSGQYWWKCEQEEPENPQMVGVVMTNEHYNLFFHYSSGPIYHLCDKCQWAGPIPTPKEPIS